jgi:regulator of protease activity HflC (stomatin/prohibitin superfamily)
MKEILEFFKTQLHHLIPIAVVYQFQMGIRLRFGKLYSKLNPGWHWKIPYIDTVMVEQSVDTTMLLPAQSVITADKKQLIVRGSVGYRISNIASFYCNVWDTRSALADRTCVVIKEKIAANTMENCLGNKLDKEFLKRVKAFAKKYGIDVFYVSLTDITESKSFRLFNDQNIIS